MFTNLSSQETWEKTRRGFLHRTVRNMSSLDNIAKSDNNERNDATQLSQNELSITIRY